jgi:hypothetical protein
MTNLLETWEVTFYPQHLLIIPRTMAQFSRCTNFQVWWITARRVSQARDRKTVQGAKKHTIDAKVCRFARKVCREESVGHP